MNTETKTLVLAILDGWGYRKGRSGNAVVAAATPTFDYLWTTFPRALIQASGLAVGLPSDQMGNSEVGHLTIGAGRTVAQELTRVALSLKEKSLFRNSALVEVCRSVRKQGSTLHLLGLCSEGGVHSHLKSLFTLIEIAKLYNISDVCIHIITDGRDSPPAQGKSIVRQIEDYIKKTKIGRIATLSGRYYAMDRNSNWERTKRTYDIMTGDNLISNYSSACDVLKEAYSRGITDEFLQPTRIDNGLVKSHDGCIFFNFRADRARQLTMAFIAEGFDGFERKQIKPLHFVTFTRYSSELSNPVVFKPQDIKNSLGETVAKNGLKQLRIAETEKYAHVTYFFNCGIEKPYKNEERILIPSPSVSNYVLTPEMSAHKITTTAISAIEKQQYALIVINYANPDMLGHTGQMRAAISAIETVDQCLCQLFHSILKMDATLIVTADHGNAELMSDERGNIHTAHTQNLVPFILAGRNITERYFRQNISISSYGSLADVAPTILDILRIPQPSDMTGKTLLRKNELNMFSQIHPSAYL